MKKVMFIVMAAFVLTVASRFMTVQAEEMAAPEMDAMVEAVSDEVGNELDQVNEMTNEIVDEAVNEVMDEVNDVQANDVEMAQ